LFIADRGIQVWRKDNMARRLLLFIIYSLFVGAICAVSVRSGIAATVENSSPGTQDAGRFPTSSDHLAQALGIEFVTGSTSSFMVKRNGRRYLVNLVTRSVTPAEVPVETSSFKPTRIDPPSSQVAAQPEGERVFEKNCATCHGPDGKGIASFKTPDFTNPAVQASLTDAQMTGTIENGKPGTTMPAFGSKLSGGEIKALQTFVRSLASKPGGELAQQAAAKPKRKIYDSGDDVVFTLPTGRPIARHGLYLDFAHRFPYFATFSDPASGGALGGLDDFAIPSFGFRYGVTDQLSVSIYRETSIIGRPIQFLGVYDFMEEEKGSPFNAAVGVAMQGQNDFSKNFAESLEGIFSKSLSSRAQLYLVPTLTINNRPLQQVTTYLSSGIPTLPGHNTFSLGVGGALDIRPTVALVAEVIPTLANGRPMGILRPAFSFGIKKKIWRHAFTFGWTTAPGTTVAERAGTRASFLGQPNADTPSGLFIGFDLSRQLF
jgi:mono/diheme cytochrome c family protein